MRAETGNDFFFFLALSLRYGIKFELYDQIVNMPALLRVL